MAHILESEAERRAALRPREQARDASRPGPLVAVAVFGCLLIGRLLGIYYIYFWEEDEVSLATGVASLVTDNIGGLYRYTVQFGYYRLVEALDLLAGGSVALIPALMHGLSAAAGTLIPTLGLYAFRAELTARERWLAVLVLACNPILWMSSRYGNTAIAAAALATSAIVVLSNRPRRQWQVAALALFIMAVLVRADSVLLAPVVAYLVYRNEGTVGRALALLAPLGLALLAVYAAVMGLDPRADNAGAAIARHMSAPFQTRFWEYLLWAMSPIPLLLGVWGIRGLLETRPRLVWLLVLWALPMILFYYRATTTPRYFVSVAVPLSLAIAVGISDLVLRLKTWLPARTAWVLVLLAASAHLFIALDRFRPDWTLQPLFGASFRTHDGLMPTGALLYQTYLEHGILAQSLRHDGFGRAAGAWEGLAFTKGANRLADHRAPVRNVVVLFSGAWDHAFHYHAMMAGARYLSHEPSITPWASKTWFQLGNARVMTIAEQSDYYRDLSGFPVEPGDELWVFHGNPFPDSLALSKLPPGLVLDSLPAFDSHIQVFQVNSRSARP